VYKLVLEHERLSRAIAERRGGPKQEDPLIAAATRPRTLKQTLQLEKDPAHSREQLIAHLRESNAKLQRELDVSGALPAPSSAPVPQPQLSEGVELTNTPLQRPPVRPPVDVVTSTIDRVKALCVAQEGDVKEVDHLCERPELSQEPPRREP